MNRKTVVVVVLFLLIFVLVGAPESLAQPQYLTNLSAVFGDGSCGTCHVIVSGGEQRNLNGTLPLNSYGTNSYGTLFENQPDHETDPSAAMIAIGPPPTETTALSNTPQAGIGTQATPGFEIVVSLFGLFVCALLLRRNNK